MRRRISVNRRGAVAVLTALSMVVLLSVVALAVDGGTLMAERRHAQATADAAALAAASDLYANYWTNSGADVSGTAKQSALDTAKSNGYANDGNTSVVTVNIPPQSGPYTGKAGYVEVIVQYNQARGFSNIFSSGNIPVKARAVAIGSPVAAYVGIHVLNKTVKGALNGQGSGASNVTGTPVIVNSNNAEAAIAGGGGSLAADNFYITGNYSTSGGGSFIGNMHTGVAPTADPLADIPVPDPTQMSIQSTKKTQFTSGNQTLSPGVYQGGISVSGSGSLTLQPGVYYMQGGGFSFSGQGNLYGNGVMIYNEPGNGNSDGISVSGLGSLTLTPPTSGVYQGLTFFQDRTSTVTGNISGTSGTTSITGTFYFAGALLQVSGNGGVVNVGSQYISDTLTLGGNGGIYVNWQPNQVARQRQINLVE